MYKNLTRFTTYDSPAAHWSLARVIIITTCVILCHTVSHSQTFHGENHTLIFELGLKNSIITLKYGPLWQPTFLPLGMGVCLYGSYLE